MRQRFLPVLGVLLCLLVPHTAAADDPDFLAFASGFYDFDDNEKATEFRGEYRSDFKLWIFKPFGGLMGTSEETFNAYAGIMVDVYIGRRLVLTPSFAPGYWSRGNGKDLGHEIEFRSSVELAWRFDDRSRVGVSIYHLSNASLSNNNPGTNVISFSYAIPLSKPKF